MKDGVRTNSARAVLAGNVYSLNSESKSDNDNGTYEIEEHSIPRDNCGTAVSKRKEESLMSRLVYQSSHTTKELEQREGNLQAASQVICRSRSQTRVDSLI